MSTTELKNKIANQLNTIDDSKVLKSVLHFLNDLKNPMEINNLSENQLDDLDRRRENYLAGKSKMTTLEEIKSTFK